MNEPSIPVITRREKIGAMRIRSRRTRQVAGTARLFALMLLGNFALAWVTMISIGIAHRDWWHLVPTMSYGTAFLLTSILLVAGVVITAVTELIREI